MTAPAGAARGDDDVLDAVLRGLHRLRPDSYPRILTDLTRPSGRTGRRVLRVMLGDATVVVKVAAGEADDGAGAHSLASERDALERLADVTVVPRCLGWHSEHALTLLLLEDLAGVTLEDLARSSNPLFSQTGSDPRTLDAYLALCERATTALASSLARLRERGAIHGDLAPSNVLVTSPDGATLEAAILDHEHTTFAHPDDRVPRTQAAALRVVWDYLIMPPSTEGWTQAMRASIVEQAEHRLRVGDTPAPDLDAVAARLRVAGDRIACAARPPDRSDADDDPEGRCDRAPDGAGIAPDAMHDRIDAWLRGAGPVDLGLTQGLAGLVRDGAAVAQHFGDDVLAAKVVDVASALRIRMHPDTGRERGLIGIALALSTVLPLVPVEERSTWGVGLAALCETIVERLEASLSLLGRGTLDPDHRRAASDAHTLLEIVQTRLHPTGGSCGPGTDSVQPLAT